jgi:hypothetical protein
MFLYERPSKMDNGQVLKGQTYCTLISAITKSCFNASIGVLATCLCTLDRVVHPPSIPAIFFWFTGAHAKFQNSSFHLSGRKVRASERKRRGEEDREIKTL